MISVKRAKELRAIIETAATGLDDKTASSGVELYPTLRNSGELIAAGTRINWNGTLKRAATDLWDTAENAPDAASDLWEDIQYHDGVRIIPDVITAGLAFAKDEQGYRDGKLYVSLIDGNVWTPEAYPTGWALVE